MLTSENCLWWNSFTDLVSASTSPVVYLYTVHHFAHVSHIQPQYVATALFVFLPAVMFGTTVLVTLTLVLGGILLVFHFTLFCFGAGVFLPFLTLTSVLH